ncbi:hypothetical protein [Asticcacaulis benevestitus]|uniref:hypothetical protein n=1 Tax=Asticcacaulis benevestitus TaxID=347481 RepID=UPI0012F7F9AA|nr:hypothetical protein [Asticcacaulis benevestitus]
MTYEQIVEAVEWLVLDSIGPKVNGMAGDIILGGMAQAMTRIAMATNKIEQREAMQMIRSMFMAKPNECPA